MKSLIGPVLLLASFLPSTALQAAPGSELLDTFAQALPIEMEACTEKETAASLSNGYEVECARFKGIWKEFRRSWADLLKSRQDLEPLGKMKWDLRKDGIRKFHFRHGDRSGMVLLNENDGRVHFLLRIPTAWCRDILPDDMSDMRKRAIHGKPGITYPVRVEQSYVQPAWPVGVPWDPVKILSARISMIIDPDGVPRDFCIEALDPDLQEIAESAVDAVRRWRYSPGIYDGKAVPVAVTVKMKFDPHMYRIKVRRH